jgi:cytochrome P450
MEYFAFRLPVTVICELLGVPEQDRFRFRPLGHELTAALELKEDFQGLEAADAATLELRAYFAELAGRRRKEPQDDLVSALVQVNDAHDGRLSDVELICNLILLLVAGFETTTNLLGNGLYLGFEHPEVLESVNKGEIPVGAFVEEVLRYDSPVQLTSRLAMVDGAMVGEQRVPKGEEILLLMGAANRDPRRFENPDVFDPTRPDNVPLSFGAGIHYCLGQGLARLEGQVALERLFARFPEVFGEQFLVDAVRVDLACDRVFGQLRGRVGDFCAAAVVDAHVQGEAVVVFGAFLGDFEFVDDGFPEAWASSGPADADAEFVHFVDAAADGESVEGHQPAHLLG